MERKVKLSTTLLTLPGEIIEEILSRLPVDALLRFRCVSKSWRGLVRNPRFIKMHFYQSLKNNPKIIVAYGRKLFSIDFEASDGASATELVIPFDHPVERILVIGCCNGLICLNDKHNILVWNPVMRELIKIRDDPRDFSPRPIFIHLGFGYNPITGEYKVLKSVNYREGNRERTIVVRTLGENSWRILGSFPYDLYSLTCVAFPNGALHWVASRRASHETKFILSFDLRDEKFREMLLPDFVNKSTPLRLAVLGGLLCICCYIEIKACFEIWVMKKYGDENSWTKQFSQRQTELTKDIRFLKPLGFRRNGEVLVENNYRGFALYDPVSKGIRDLNIRGIPDRFIVKNHLESLVSPVAGHIP